MAYALKLTSLISKATFCYRIKSQLNNLEENGNCKGMCILTRTRTYARTHRGRRLSKHRSEITLPVFFTLPHLTIILDL